ncbi:hypothetical protein [Pedobacter xixiisoli]|nr:hypothetical protein [Pedobacter xixiisoli]
MPSHKQKYLQTSISNSVNISKKKKSPSVTKIKLHSTKARLFFSQSNLPDLPFSIKTKSALPVIIPIIGWNTFENFSYRYIYSYLYPKHAFW